MQSVYTINGNDFYKYDHELDWSGRLFEQYEEEEYHREALVRIEEIKKFKENKK